MPLGSLITAAGQRLSSELDSALREAGHPELRAAHARLFMAIDADGTRVTELAERMGITKQATGELVRHLERHGYVGVTVEADDQRARRVSLTDSGWAAIRTGMKVVDEFDRWLAGTIGAPQVEQLRGILHRIIATDPADRGKH